MRKRAVVLVGLAFAFAPAAAASADDGEQQVTHYAESVQLDPDGTAHIAIDLSLDFADTPGHGPYLTIPVREATDDGRTRLYEVGDVSASSPSNAPADVSVEDAGDLLEVRIGDPAIGDVDGVQQYHVEYSIGGLLNTDATTNDGDQLYWDAIGPDWEIPLSDVTISVEGPTVVERVKCFAGAVGSTASCSSADLTGTSATFTQAALEAGEPLTVVAGWPAGTFPGAVAMFEDDPGTAAGSDNDFPGGTLELGEDGLPPSFVQEDGGSWSEVDSSGFGSSASGFGVFIGFGVIAVIAVIVVTVVRTARGPGAPPADVMSLAARGYLRMDPVAPDRPGGRANWNLVPLRPMDAGLTARERAWYRAIFVGGMVPVYWSVVHRPVHHSSHSSFNLGFGAGGGGGFGGDGGAGGGAGGGGGGSW